MAEQGDVPVVTESGGGQELEAVRFSNMTTISTGDDFNIRDHIVDRRECDILGMDMLSPEHLILTDWRNKAVKLVDVNTREITARVQLSDNPFDVTILPDDQLAVTCTQSHKIHIIAYRHNDIRQVRELRVDGYCTGIDYRNGRLAVMFSDYNSNMPKRLEIMDLDGVVQHTISYNGSNKIRENNGYVMFALSGQEVFLTSDDASVKKVDFSGGVWTSLSDHKLQYPRGIVVPDPHGILVCCEKTNSVLHMEEGLPARRFLSGEGLDNPRSICYCHRSGRLFVSNKNSDILKSYRIS